MTVPSYSQTGERRLAGARKFGPVAPPTLASYIESVAVVAVCSVVIYFMTTQAFTGFFYGEDFNTTSLYIAANHNFFKAIFTPLIIFFRPTAYAWILITQSILPWDPVVHHWRNFIVLILCLWLLHRIMIRLVDSRWARLIGMTLITFSKVNLMLIGLINCIEVLGTVVYPLTAFLFLVRYFQSGRSIDYTIAIVFFILCAFSRDSNVLFFGVVFVAFAANCWQMRHTARGIWMKNAIRLLPFAAASAVYAGTRYWLLGLPKAGAGTPYALHFDFLYVATKFYYFLGILTNVPIGVSYVAGPGDLSTFANASPRLQIIYQIALVTAVVLTIVVGVIWALRRDIAFVVPLVWASALLAPTLLIGNWQNYYAFEPIIALSLALAMTLDQTGPNFWLKAIIWPPLLALIGANGYISNQNVHDYAWRWVADRESRLNDEIYKKHLGEPIKALTLVVDDDNNANLYTYIVQPVTVAINHVPLLNRFLSPTVEQFHAVAFSNFNLKGIARSSDQLVYRMNAFDETFTDITHRTVEFASVDADSALDQTHSAERVFDHHATAGPTSSWISAAQPSPHKLTIRFAKDTPIGSIRIVNPSDYRIADLEVRVLSMGEWKSIFDKKHLDDKPVIDVRWPDLDASSIELVVKSSTHNGAPSPTASIQALDFPENREVGASPKAP